MQEKILNLINEEFSQHSTIVSNSFPSLYSKSDVASVLTKFYDSIEKIIKTELENVDSNDGKVKYTIEQINDALDYLDINDYCDLERDDAEFELDGNVIYLTKCDATIDSDNLIRDIEHQLKQTNR